MSKQIFLYAALFSTLIISLSLDLSAKELNYSKLQMQDLEQMRQHVKTKVRQAQDFLKEDDRENALNHLIEASELAFSRPDQDNIIGELFKSIRPRLKDIQAYESALSSLTQQAINKLNNEKLKAAHRATQLILLENLMAELRPELKNNKKLKSVFEKIRDAKIKIPKAVRQNFVLTGAARPKGSPSETAKKILEN